MKTIKTDRTPKWIITAVLVTALVFSTVSLPQDVHATDNTDMEITILDVGHGDAAVIESDGRYIVIDGGFYKRNDVILGYLRDRGVSDIDLVVSSHWDGDHVGGLNQVIRQFNIGEVWYSSYFVSNDLTNNVMNAIERRVPKYGTPNTGDVRTIGNATVEVISDGRNYDAVSRKKTVDILSNNSSLIVKVTAGGKSALFTGDSRSEAEDIIAKSKLNCDILKASHHGDFYGTSAKFIKKATPAHTAFSVGAENTKGMPNFHILYNLSNAGSVAARTDMHGSIRYKVVGGKIEMTTVKSFPSINSASISGLKSRYAYKKGKAIKPVPTVKLNGSKLRSRENKVCYTTASSKSCYHFSKTCKSIKGVSTIKSRVARCESKGKRACGYCVKTALDYKVKYLNNKKRGRATVIITGLGRKCHGIATRTFVIK